MILFILYLVGLCNIPSGINDWPRWEPQMFEIGSCVVRFIFRHSHQDIHTKLAHYLVTKIVWGLHFDSMQVGKCFVFSKITCNKALKNSRARLKTSHPSFIQRDILIFKKGKLFVLLWLPNDDGVSRMTTIMWQPCFKCERNSQIQQRQSFGKSTLSGISMCSDHIIVVYQVRCLLFYS